MLLVLSQIASAVVANQQKFNYTQPDGSVVTLQMHGDEYYHWVTMDGKPVILGEDGFYHSETQASLSMRRQLGLNSRRQREMQIQKSGISEGDHRFLVLLIEFSDEKFTVNNPQQAFYNLLNQQGYSVNGGTGSARDYYVENSKGLFTPEYDVVGPITLDNGYATYGRNTSSGDDADPQRALYEACLKADPYVDFSEYDIDGDGYVDNVFFFFAGHNEAEGADPSTIWPHKWVLYKYNCQCDGVRVYNYACTSEYRGSGGATMCGIGTFCHEFGHVLGLPDLYDTDYENNGQAADMEDYSLMAHGSYNNNGRTPPYLTCMEKSILGWMGEPVEWTTGGQKTVAGIQDNVSYFTKTSMDGEIFIYETRTGTGWDSYVEPGLAIYHLDRSDRTVAGSSTAKDLWNMGHNINAMGSHPCYYMIQASRYYYTFGGRSGNTQFSSTSNPGSIDWDGKASGYDLTDIRFADGVTTLTLNIDNDRKVVGTVKGVNGLALQNVSISLVPKSAMAQALSSADGKRTLGVIDNESLQKVAKYRTLTDKDGKYKIVLDDPEGTSYYIVASKESYISQSKEISSVAGTAVADFRMIPQFITSKSDLQKYDGISYSRVGYGEAPCSIMGAVGFTEDELSGYVGDKLTSISFMFDGNHADNVYVVVDIDDERVLTKKLDTVVYGEMNTVDISNENIIIPAGHDMFIGYALENVDSGYPLVTGSNSYVDGGMYYSDFNLRSVRWRVWEANIIVSATAEPQRKDFTDMGFNLIKNDKSRWTAGEEFVFALVDSSVKPESVVWYYDEKQTSEAKVRLTSGSHSIVAIITNYDGSTDELELILDVD